MASSSSSSCCTIINLMIIYFSGFIIIISTVAQSESLGRAPHGLANEHPLAFSPSAFEFFHPCSASSQSTACSPLPMAAAAGSGAASTVSSSLARESRSGTGSNVGGAHVGTGAIIAVAFGCVIGVAAAVGVLVVLYVAAVKRRTTTKALV